MSFFTRMMKQERGYDGSFASTGAGAPPSHLRDKNKSHSGQGASATSIPSQQGALAQQQADGDETDYQRVDVLDTTNK
jgi:hypothetical protein